MLPRRSANALLTLLFTVGSALRADEPPPLDTQINAPPLTTPAEAVAAFRTPPGFHVTLFAAEPDVRQPIGIATDAAGRVWVAENYTYAEAPGTLLEQRITTGAGSLRGAPP